MKLPRIESLIILVFLGCVVLWGISKCSSRRSDMVRRVTETTDEENEDRPVRHDTIRVPSATTSAETPQMPAPSPKPVQQTTPTTTTPSTSTVPGTRPSRPTLSNETQPKPAAPAASSSSSTSSAKYSSLYVTIDGLKLRKQPGLKGEVVATLELYEEVYFLNKKSEKTEEISLGLEKVTDHWVKVRTKSGKEGWVFGAGVHYYKMKRKGVL